MAPGGLPRGRKEGGKDWRSLWPVIQEGFLEEGLELDLRISSWFCLSPMLPGKLKSSLAAGAEAASQEGKKELYWGLPTSGLPAGRAFLCK